MYKEYFGFTHMPFTKQVPQDEVFSWDNFAHFQHRMEFVKRHGGIALIWGEPGTGKTIALKWLRDSLNHNRFRFYYSANPPMSLPALYRELALSMDLIPLSRSVDLFRQLQDHIVTLSREKRIVPIIALDECHMIPHPVLQTLRLILNFELDSQDHAIMILSGQPPLRKRLQYAVYEPLVQRITVEHHFDGLTRETVEGYMLHRLTVAGVTRQLFEEQTIQFIYQVTKGNMRKINTLAIKALELAAKEGKQTVEKTTVESVLHEHIWA
jgi:type II secretory pathway predicted ATPase ExeA